MWEQRIFAYHEYDDYQRKMSTATPCWISGEALALLLGARVQSLAMEVKAWHCLESGTPKQMESTIINLFDKVLL